MRSRLAPVLFVVFVLPLPLFGYLDPGSGSMLFSAMVGIVATLFFVAKGLFFKLASVPGYISGRKSVKQGTRNIVFYSEGGQYWNVFKPIIQELNRRGVECSYLTSKENDPGLCSGLENVEARYIGDGNKAFFMLNTIEADLCVMTIPGLDVLQIKRSKGVKKYCHITHSAGGCSGYSTFGLDYYDIVLTGGEADKRVVEELEKVRNIREKKVEVIGCTYLDVLREQLAEIEKSDSEASNGRKTVLVSPTWGQHSLLNKFGERILTEMTAEDKVNIIIRPHPQSFISDSEMIDRLMKKFPESETLKWDREPNGLKSMAQADLMISDFSGIIFDFLFLFEKPVITFKGQYDKRGKDSMDLSYEPWNISVLDKIGETLKEDEIDLLPEKITKFIDNSHSFLNALKDLRSDMDKYPGESGIRGADLLLNFLKNIKEGKN